MSYLACVLSPVQTTSLDEAENLDTETQHRRVKLCEGSLEFPVHHPKMSVTTQGPLRASKKHSNTTPSASKSAIVSLFCKPRETQESGRWGFPRLSSALTHPALWVSTLCSFSFSLNSVTLLSLTLAPSLCPQPQSHRPAGECAPLSQMQAGRGPCLVPLL